MIAESFLPITKLDSTCQATIFNHYNPFRDCTEVVEKPLRGMRLAYRYAPFQTLECLYPLFWLQKQEAMLAYYRQSGVDVRIIPHSWRDYIWGPFYYRWELHLELPYVPGVNEITKVVIGSADYRSKAPLFQDKSLAFRDVFPRVYWAIHANARVTEEFFAKGGVPC